MDVQSALVCPPPRAACQASPAGLRGMSGCLFLPPCLPATVLFLAMEWQARLLMLVVHLQPAQSGQVSCRASVVTASNAAIPEQCIGGFGWATGVQMPSWRSATAGKCLRGRWRRLMSWARRKRRMTGADISRSLPSGVRPVGATSSWVACRQPSKGARHLFLHRQACVGGKSNLDSTLVWQVDCSLKVFHLSKHLETSVKLTENLQQREDVGTTVGANNAFCSLVRSSNKDVLREWCRGTSTRGTSNGN